MKNGRPDSLTAAVFAPLGRDAALATELLEQAGVRAVACTSFEALCDQIRDGVAAVLVTEEVMTGARVRELAALLREQPSWSDLPIIVFSFRVEEVASSLAHHLQELGNVSFVDRPVRRRTLLATVKAALRARQRQYGSRKEIEARDQFLAMLGHELRNPLASIQLATEAIARWAAGDTQVTKNAATITRQTRHLSRLVDDLLDVSRVTSGKVVLKRERVELGALVQRSVDALQAMADSHGVTLRCEPELQPIVVEADVVRLEQVATNLVTNALKYTPAGGSVEVTVAGVRIGERARGPEHAMLRVRDNGVGIDPQFLGAIFDPFTQVPTGLDRAKGGLGLGLTLVRALVELHGGTVEALSQGLGKGSDFRVRLPFDTGVEADDAVSEAMQAAPPPAFGIRVVVVEDNSDIRESVTELLEMIGFQVETASTGPEGLSRIVAARPDVALVDIGLPGFDGYELARRARGQLGAGVGLIAMTGYGQPEDRARALQAGFNEHVTKPISVDDIGSAINRVRRGEPEEVFSPRG